MRKEDREKAQRAAFAERLKVQVAGLVGERYPHVAELTFELQYRDPDGLASSTTDHEFRGPTQSARFEFKCPYRECVEGGHDLTKPVADMLNKRLGSLTGASTCRGWQDQERVGSHRCLGELTYTVTAKYRS